MTTIDFEPQDFDPRELCSRKLWQLVNAPATTRMDDAELSRAIAELERRRHYLQELAELGKLPGSFRPG